MIAYAYGLKRNEQVLGGPDWLDKTHFDIVGVVGDAEVAKLRSMPGSNRQMEWNLILQSFLAERFQLKANPEEREMPIFALVVAKSGSKLKPSTASDKGQHLSMNSQQMTATGASMDFFASVLTHRRESGERTVVNRTGLTGVFDFTLDWSTVSEASDQTNAADFFILAGGPVIRIAESRESCAPFIAFFAMSGRWRVAPVPMTIPNNRQRTRCRIKVNQRVMPE